MTVEARTLACLGAVFRRAALKGRSPAGGRWLNEFGTWRFSMTDQSKKRELGEGNYEATRDYNERTEEFLKDKKPEDIEQKAREAAKALEGAEGDELRAAEKKGKSEARK